MPGLDWTVSESGVERFEEFLAHAYTTSGDMTEPLTDAKDWVQQMIFDEFLTEGGRSGGWLPLDQHYDLWKINHGQYEILQLKPELLHGDPGTPRFTKMIEPLLSDLSWNITPLDAEFRPDTTRAVWHQEGVPHSRGKGGPLPPRPMLVFIESDYEIIEDAFERWMEEDVLIKPFFGDGYKRYLGGFF